MSAEISFTKQNLDDYLRMLAKEFRKRNGKNMPAEITLIGGASILINYGFRDNTYDFDAIIRASSAMKEAINFVADQNSLPTGWFNSDFKNTKSYSPKLEQYSVYYKTFSNILTVRTITGEYLVAMKLMSFRQYKNDISDIIGIYREQMELGSPITKDKVKKAVTDLYGSWDQVSIKAQNFIEQIELTKDLDILYQQVRQEEVENKEALVEFESEYPSVLKEGNVDSILKNIQHKKKELKSPKL